METRHVDGRQPAHITLYALSTCGWCRKTKALLAELGLGYDYIDVDQLAPEDSDAVRDEMMKWNPRCSFPTLVIDEQSCIVGFKEDELRRLADDADR